MGGLRSPISERHREPDGAAAARAAQLLTEGIRVDGCTGTLSRAMGRLALRLRDQASARKSERERAGWPSPAGGWIRTWTGCWPSCRAGARETGNWSY